MTGGQGQTSTDRDSAVIAEREESDKARELEREQQDSALDRERQERQLVVEALLSIERLRTDTFLNQERKHSDRAAKQALADLSHEQARHAETQEASANRELSLGMICHDLKTTPSRYPSDLNSCDGNFRKIRGTQRMSSNRSPDWKTRHCS